MLRSQVLRIEILLSQFCVAFTLTRVRRLRRYKSYEFGCEQRLEGIAIVRSYQDCSYYGECSYKTAHGTQHVKQTVCLASYSRYITLQIDRKSRQRAPC